MNDVSVIPVGTAKERRLFLELPWRLYREDPLWVPPLRDNQRRLAGFGSHAFYDQAEVQTFLVTKQGHPCGRAAAIINHAHNQKYQEQRGFFGFFESVHCETVAGRLLNAVADWLRQRGMTAMRGPVNPSLNYECGLLVEGFDRPPVFMMPYNPPWYGRLLEAHGLQGVQDLYAFWGHVNMVPHLSEKHERMRQAVKERFGIAVRPMSRRSFQQDVAAFLWLYNQSLEGSWGFVPLSAREMRTLAGGLRHLLVPELTRIAEINGRPIGAIFGLPDYNPRIREIDGRLWPIGFWKLVRQKQRLQRIRFVSANVLPEYQQWGVGLMLTREFLRPVLENGIQEVEFSWVLESNHLSRSSLKKGGAKHYKTYRIYDLAL